MRRPPVSMLSSSASGLPRSQFVEASERRQHEAQALLADRSFALLTEEQAAYFSEGRVTKSATNTQFVLLRGLKPGLSAPAPINEAMSELAVIPQGRSVCVSWSGGRREVVPNVRTAVVAVLPNVPDDVYTYTSLAIVGGVIAR